MTKLSIIFTWRRIAALAGLLALSIGVSSAEEFRWYGARIQGVWNARVNITNCGPGNVPGSVVLFSFNATNVFAADGTFLDANSQNPATQSTHLGYWRHVRGHRFEFAQKFYLFDAAGQSTGWRIVRHEVTLAPGGDSFASQGTAENFNNDGILVGTGCSTSTGIRFD